MKEQSENVNYNKNLNTKEIASKVHKESRIYSDSLHMTGATSTSLLHYLEIWITKYKCLLLTNLSTLEDIQVSLFRPSPFLGGISHTAQIGSTSSIRPIGLAISFRGLPSLWNNVSLYWARQQVQESTKDLGVSNLTPTIITLKHFLLQFTLLVLLVLFLKYT